MLFGSFCPRIGLHMVGAWEDSGSEDPFAGFSPHWNFLGLGASSLSLVCVSCGDGAKGNVRIMQSDSLSPTMNLCEGHGIFHKAAMGGGG